MRLCISSEIEDGMDTMARALADGGCDMTALELVKQRWSGPPGAYPGAGYFEMPHWNFVDVIEPDALVERARGWVDQGVSIPGGCCGLGPKHIRALSGAADELTQARGIRS